MSRPALWFDRDPQTTAQRMKALMPTEQTARVIYATADPRKVGIWKPLRIAAEQWFRKHGRVA